MNSLGSNFGMKPFSTGRLAVSVFSLSLICKTVFGLETATLFHDSVSHAAFVTGKDGDGVRREVLEVGMPDPEDVRADWIGLSPMKFQRAYFSSFPKSIFDDGGRVWAICPVEGTFAANSAAYQLFRLPKNSLSGHKLTKPTLRRQAKDWGAVNSARLTDVNSQVDARGSGYHCVDQLGGEFGRQFSRFGHLGDDASAGKKCAVALQPLGPQAIALFVASEPASRAYDLWNAHESRALHVFEYQFGNVQDVGGRDTLGDRVEWRGVWTRRGVFPCSFVEPFCVVASTEGNYLITEVGDIWKSSWRNEPSAPMTRLPLRGGELVQAVIYDAERNNTAFAFTSNHWFEVKESIKYHDFEIGSLRPDERMQTLVYCAREVRKHYPVLETGRKESSESK